MKRTQIYGLYNSWAVMSPWYQHTLAGVRRHRYTNLFLRLLGE